MMYDLAWSAQVDRDSLNDDQVLWSFAGSCMNYKPVHVGGVEIYEMIAKLQF
jgi:hypothetical protein